MPIPETISPALWSLAGSVETPTRLSPATRSLTLIRPINALSSQIRSAMNAKSIVPAVQIDTANGAITLLHAKIGNIVPVPRTKHKHGAGTNELEEIELTFAQITITRKQGKKGLTDNWNVGG